MAKATKRIGKKVSKKTDHDRMLYWRRRALHAEDALREIRTALADAAEAIRRETARYAEGQRPCKHCGALDGRYPHNCLTDAPFGFIRQKAEASHG